VILLLIAHKQLNSILDIPRSIVSLRQSTHVKMFGVPIVDVGQNLQPPTKIEMTVGSDGAEVLLVLFGSGKKPLDFSVGSRHYINYSGINWTDQHNLPWCIFR
jgi:hypothetical protein